MAIRKEEVRITADVSSFVTKLAAAGAAAGSFADRLDEADGRMSNMVQSTLALGPALVPLGAAAVPAIAGLTAQLGLSAAAAGTTVLAFHGVGKALSALNAYQLDPSTANLQKLQESMAGLGPEARRFVTYLDSIRPALQGLRRDAQAGVLPGAQEGLEHLMHLLPQVHDLISTVAQTSGDLFAEAGDNLDDPRWRDFFTYLQDNARPLLLDLGRTVGNFAETFANLTVAFDPLTQRWSTGLLGFSRTLRDATANLDSSQGFQDFLDYVEANGPRVADTLASIGNAAVQLVQAAAPVGPVALAGIRLLADSLAAIADSPIGPVLVSAAAAVGVLGRSLALLQTVGLRGGGGGFLQKTYIDPARRLVPAMREAAAATLALEAAQAKASKAQGGPTIVPGARGAVASQRQLESAAQRVAVAERNKAAAFRESAAAAGKGVAVAGGLAFAMSGVADKTAFANTATLALLGSIGGVPGIVGGAAVGSILDFAHANDTLEHAISRADDAISSSNLGDQRRELSALAQQYAQTLSIQGLFSGKFAANFLGGGLGKARSTLRELSTAIDDTRKSSGDISDLLGSGLSSALGTTAHDFHIAAESAREFRASLESVDSFLTKRADLRAYQQALDDFAKSLKDNGKHFHEFGQAGRENNAALDNIAASAVKFAGTLNGLNRVKFLAGARAQFMQAAEGMGYTADQAHKLADQIKPFKNLSPKIKFKAEGVAATAAELRKLADQYHKTPRQIKTLISEAGAKPTQAKIEALARKYNLTPKQVKTILTANDQASKKADAAVARAKRLERKFAAVMDVIDHASGPINSVRDQLQSLNGKRADSYIYLHHITVNSVRGNPGSGVKRDAQGNAIANGGIFRNFAAGDVANAHRPMIERQPTYRMWAEPETKGEAYIPLANDWRRPRAVAIWEETGRLIGQLANGGVNANSLAGARMATTISRDVIVNFNAPVNGTDANELARKAAQRVNTAAAMTAAMP